MPQAGTAALRAWGHCPPTTAEKRLLSHAGDQSLEARAPEPLAWSSGLRNWPQSTTTEGKWTKSGKSHDGGKSPECCAASLWTLHLLTAPWAAFTTAAGESKSKRHK